MSDRTSSLYDGTMERTADGGVIRFERHLEYGIRDVWDAITNPERLADWWLPFDAEITIDLRAGGESCHVACRVGEGNVEVPEAEVRPGSGGQASGAEQPDRENEG